MKTRYTIIEPVPFVDIRTSFDLAEWVEVEFKRDKQKPLRHVLSPDEAEQIPLAEFNRVLDPLFPGANWERVQVNSARGASDMFVDEIGGPKFKNLPINEFATMVYWTATLLHIIDKEAGPRLPTYAAMRVEALRRAAVGIKGVEIASGLYRDTPRIHGRAVLFEERVWF